MKNKVVINTDIVKGTINPNIYGHFAEHLGRCIYEGVWVGKDSPIPNTNGIRNDVVEALRNIKVPVLRWPGGCFADEYHWKDGVGPVDQRKKMVNTHWGGVIENNHFGTHEFLMFCEMIGAEPYISGNVGSGTVQEMSEWVEYMTFDGESPMANWRRENGQEKPWKLKYFGVGNENWGCGGRMRQYYADLYRRYQTYVRSYGDNEIFKIACGPNRANYHWMEVLMREAHEFMDGISLHHYTVPGDNWSEKGSALDFTDQEWVVTMRKALQMDELITKHTAIMDQYDPDKRVALIVDEWGTWFDVEPGTHPRFLHQQNSIRDALVAGLTFHIFHQHCDRVQMANIAQLVNVLQAVILTEGEKMILTPTYHVFEMYKDHQGAELIDTHCDISTYEENLPQISVSASRSKEGKIIISLCNLDHQSQADVNLDLRGLTHSNFEITGRELSSNVMNAHNNFEEPNNVVPKSFHSFTREGTNITATLSPMSVTVLEVTV